MLDCVELRTSGVVDASVIWLHGLGADGHDFEGVVDELELPGHMGVHFVFPNAPVMPVTINGGMRMRAWYDIVDGDIGREPDHAGIRKSASLVAELLQRELDAGIPSRRIVLAGFSQGGVIALHLGLRSQSPLAGILALSTYAPTAESLGDEMPKACQATPVLMCHGTFDPIVPLQLGASSAAALRGAGVPVDFRTYPMPHSVCQEELATVSAWLQTTLGANG